MTYETHHHCQCDFCDGVDCGQNDPEKYAAEQKAQQEEHDGAVREKLIQDIITAMDKADSDGFANMPHAKRIVESFRTRGLKEENKPGCFGAIGLPGKRNDPGCPCAWQERCRQSQEDC